MSSQNDQALKEFRAKLSGLLGDFDESAKRVIAQQSGVGAASVRKNTPVGDYTGPVIFYTESGKLVYFEPKFKKQGGTMRRSWVKSRTHKNGGAWIGGYVNNLEYAIYVNNGHRIVDRWGETHGYVKGQRMLEKSITAAESALPAIFDAEISRVKAETGF